MPKKTVEQVINSGNDYLIQVKRNKKKLYSAILETINISGLEDYDNTLEMNRSRIEQREVYVYSTDGNKEYEQWKGLKRIIYVKSNGVRKKKKSQTNRFYITSRIETDARFYNIKIRDHWKIENSLHWVKDKIMNEDNGMINGMKLSENVSAIRNFVINIYRLQGEKSIKYAIEKYANRIQDCIKILKFI